MNRTAIFAILILLLALVSSCAGIETTYTSPVYMPLLTRTATAATSAKKGCSLGPGGCDLLPQLGVSWYYSGQDCAGYDKVPYLDTAARLANAPEQEPPGSVFVMYLNECDAAYWNCPDIAEQVSLLIAAESAWPGVVWVGPCAAADAQYVREFWSLYTKQAGHMPDSAHHRACVHCYDVAGICIQRIENHLAAVAPFGMDTIWLTEFGLPLGLYRSIDDVRQENQALVDYMEQSAAVERYGYWTAKIRYYGYTIPSKPVSGFYPLAFDWLNDDGTVEERLTDMGEWFAGVGE